MPKSAGSFVPPRFSLTFLVVPTLGEKSVPDDEAEAAQQRVAPAAASTKAPRAAQAEPASALEASAPPPLAVFLGACALSFLAFVAAALVLQLLLVPVTGNAEAGLDIPAALALAVLGFVAKGVKVVGQSTEQLVERLGRYSRKLAAGLHFVVPLVETVSYRCSLRERVLDVPPQQCITTDNAPLTADAILYYRVVDSRKARYAVEALEEAIEGLVLTQLRSSIGRLTLDETFTARGALGAALLSELDSTAQLWGTCVTRVEVKDILPDQSIKIALEKQMTAERVKRADILESEGQRDASVNMADGQARAALRIAEGNAEALIVEAEARKQSAILEASGLAQGVEELAQRLAVSTSEAAELYLDRARIKTAGEIGAAPSAKVLFVDPAGVGSAASAGGKGIGALAGAAAAVADAAADDK